LLQFFESDDFVAHFRETGRLCRAFPSEIDFTALQLSLYMSQRHPRALPSHFQSQLAQTGADKTHGINATSRGAGAKLCGGRSILYQLSLRQPRRKTVLSKRAAATAYLM